MAAAGDGDAAVDGPAGPLLDPDVDVALVPPEPVSERYYKAASYFCDIKGGERHDQWVLQHSNGLCVVGVAPSHPLRAPGAARPTSVQYRGELLSKKPSGKKKIGATWLVEYSPLCDVTCEDGSTFVLYACVRGNLYEVNPRVVDNPALLCDDMADAEGYIAIIMPKRDEKMSATDELLTQEQYDLRRRGDGGSAAAGNGGAAQAAPAAASH